jgi:hypothetical protein
VGVTVGRLGFVLCYLTLLFLRDLPMPVLLYLVVVS